MDTRKDYDNMDQGRILMTLEDYNAGPHMRRLLA